MKFNWIHTNKWDASCFISFQFSVEDIFIHWIWAIGKIFARYEKKTQAPLPTFATPLRFFESIIKNRINPLIRIRCPYFMKMRGSFLDPSQVFSFWYIKWREKTFQTRIRHFVVGNFFKNFVKFPRVISNKLLLITVKLNSRAIWCDLTGFTSSFVCDSRLEFPVKNSIE